MINCYCLLLGARLVLGRCSPFPCTSLSGHTCHLGLGFCEHSCPSTMTSKLNLVSLEGVGPWGGGVLFLFLPQQPFLSHCQRQGPGMVAPSYSCGLCCPYFRSFYLSCFYPSLSRGSPLLCPFSS